VSNSGCRRCRQAADAMRDVHVPTPCRNLAADDALGAEQVKTNGRTDDIYN